MWKIPILRKAPDLPAAHGFAAHDSCLSARPLPVFYMNDYTELGLLVDRVGDTASVLEGKGYTLSREPCGAEVSLAHPGLLQDIVQVLTEYGIEWELSDVVDDVYQG
jgi:hypothetical protein